MIKNWRGWKRKLFSPRGLLVGGISSIVFILIKVGVVFLLFSPPKSWIIVGITIGFWISGGIYTIYKLKERMEIKQIINGWTNYYKDKFNLLKNDIKEQSIERYSICRRCHVNVGNTCDSSKRGLNVKTGKYVNGCGCTLPKKVMSEDSECPLGKWDKMV